MSSGADLFDWLSIGENPLVICKDYKCLCISNKQLEFIFINSEDGFLLLDVDQIKLVGKLGNFI